MSGEGDSTVKERAKRKLERDMGPGFLAELHDPKTVEILLNADGVLWVEKLGQPMRKFGTLRPAQAQAIIETIAGYHGKEVTYQCPYLEAELPVDGLKHPRFAGQLPPIVSAPVFAIRKKAISIFTLEDYVASGIMTADQAECIKDAIRRRRNIIISGSTGSGKTTLVNACIEYMVRIEPEGRPLIIEDTGEIQCAAENCVLYQTSPDVSMTTIVKLTLRMRPDRVLVGEVRGPEALDLAMLWNTGHEGGALTLHANNARAALSKLCMFISMHPNAPHPIEPLIGEVVHLVVQIARTPTGRRVEELLEVHGYVDGQYITKSI